jgi:hypothetical protein
MINQQRTYWRSLAGGEIAPEMYGRADLEARQTGVELCSNFLVTPQGAVENRTGTEYVATTKTNQEVLLEAFVRADGQGFLLEFGANYVRIYNDGVYVTELATSYSLAAVKELNVAQFVDDLAICHQAHPPAFIRRVSDSSWNIQNINFNETFAPPVGVAATAHTIAAMDPGDPKITYSYVVTTLDGDGGESGKSLPTTCDNVLRILGTNNTIAWTDVVGAEKYNVYMSKGNGAYGFIGSAKASPFIDDNITPDFFTQPSEILMEFNAANNYPSLVAFHEQRCLFANTYNAPQSFWVSGLTAFGYFKASLPPLDDQAFTYELSAKKASPILHLATLRDVLFFTANGIFRVFTSSGDPFTPKNVNAIPVSSYGAAAAVKPQELGNTILFPIERGAHLFALQYDGSASGYDARDLSTAAPHMIDGYSWKQSALQRAPFPIWWGLRSDGELIGATYLEATRTFAWQRASLPGATIESICIVPEASRDTLYVVAKRIINGSTVRYIERFAPRFAPTDDLEDSRFLDCHIVRTYGSPTSSIDQLGRLEGQQVYVLADGRPLGPYTVTGGAITIDEAATKVIVGVRFVSTLKTLPIMPEVEGYGVGIEKNISAVFVRVHRSAGLEACGEMGEFRSMISPVDELLGDTPQLSDGAHQIDIDNEWTPNAAVTLRQTLPLPVKITGLAVDYVSAG